MNLTYNEPFACEKIQNIYPDLVDEKFLQALFGIIYMVIFAFGIVGNLVIVSTLIHDTVDYSVRAILIWNLAAVDLALAVVNLPLSAIQSFARVWYFGSWSCRFIPVLQGALCFETSFTLVTIAYDRHQLAKIPRRSPVCSGAPGCLILGTWFLAVFLAVPHGVFLQLHSPIIDQKPNAAVTNMTKPPIKLCGDFCSEIWPNRETKLAYGVLVLLLQFCLPSALGIYYYGYIARNFNRRVQRRLRGETISLSTRQRLVKKGTKIRRMVFLMFLGFLVPWLPLSLVNFVRDLFDLYDHLWATSSHSFSIIFVCMHCLAMTSVIWNPVIYCFCNPGFRETVRLKCASDSLAQEPAELISHTPLFLMNSAYSTGNDYQALDTNIYSSTEQDYTVYFNSRTIETTCASSCRQVSLEENDNAALTACVDRRIVWKDQDRQ